MTHQRREWRDLTMAERDLIATQLETALMLEILRDDDDQDQEDE